MPAFRTVLSSSRLIRRGLAAVLLLAIAPGVQAAEGYDTCTGYVESLPTTISTPGTWCLNKDLSTQLSSGAAVTIAVDHVTLDCNDFAIDGAAAGEDTSAFGVRTVRRSITVRNCKLAGFSTAILLGGASFIVEDNRLADNRLRGIQVTTNSTSVIRRNRVFDTGGSALAQYAAGITVYGNADIRDNVVANVAGYNNYGIIAGAEDAGMVTGNLVRGIAQGPGGVMWGIYSEGNVSVQRNDVLGGPQAGDGGIYCSSEIQASRNIVAGFTNGIVGCSYSVFNDISP